ncbi:MAG: hypothetical protein R2794_04700 [Chitinophagales bacterium]
MDKNDFLDNVEKLTAKELFNGIINEKVSLRELEETGRLDINKKGEIIAMLDRRNYVLNNIEGLSPKQLFKAIIDEIITMEDLKKTGMLDKSKRDEIKLLLKSYEEERIKSKEERNKADEEAWKKCCDTEEGCKRYLSDFPNGIHKEDALNNIKNFASIREGNERMKAEIIEKIRTKPNSFTSGEVRDRINEGIITIDDLKEAGVPGPIIDLIINNNIIPTKLVLGETPKQIPDGYTEVYFWGIPGSGKTCALAGILSTAHKLGYLEIAQGPGFDYMLKLKNIFSRDSSFLPARSPVDSTQYLPFTLKKAKEKYARSVSLIELSGEIFQCFLFKNANKPMPSFQHESTFNSLINFLNGDNRKIHFFFIDYDLENNPDQDGYMQVDYLNAATTFFNDKNNNIFNRTTDAVYIVLTKSDLMQCDKSERVHRLKEYFNENNYIAFVNSLRSKCEENSINAKRILGTTFALGKLYFSDVCKFDPETSENIIDILMRRIAPKKESILDVFNK